jgi:hypothetical protein
MAIEICAEAFGQTASAITPSQDWSNVMAVKHEIASNTLKQLVT